MRLFLAAGILVVAAVIAINQMGGAAIDPDTPVIVRSANPIKVFLPTGNDSDTIAAYLYAEMVDVADTHSGALRADLRAMSEDRELMRWIATDGARWFRSERAAALAYGLYRVDAEPDRIAITTATVELLPPYWDIGGSIAHEDGHATINRLIAEECGPLIVAAVSADGMRGGSFETAVETELYDLGNAAHGYYHDAVNTGPSPAFAREARAAAARVIDAGC